jgi:hypothetical protein
MFVSRVSQYEWKSHFETGTGNESSLIWNDDVKYLLMNSPNCPKWMSSSYEAYTVA